MRPLKLLPLTVFSLLLTGCPDTKVPKAPPQVPEPKISFETPTPPALAKPPALLTAAPAA